MKIKCLKNVCASGNSLEAGQTYDVSESDAELLITMGRAEVYIPKPKVKKILITPTIVTPNAYKPIASVPNTLETYILKKKPTIIEIILPRR